MPYAMARRVKVSSLFTVAHHGVDHRVILPSVSRTAFPQSFDLIHPQRAKPFHRDGWVYEENVHGNQPERCQVFAAVEVSGF